MSQSLPVRIAVIALSFSAAGFAGLVAHESYTSMAVIPTVNDRPTVGFGSTFRDDGTPVRMGDTITPVQAIKRTQAHIANSETKLKRCVTGDLSQAEYDILVNFSYQYGEFATCKSTMVREINAGNYAAACRGYPLYIMSGRMNCTLPQYKRKCGGVVTRNLERQANCLAAQ